MLWFHQRPQASFLFVSSPFFLKLQTLLREGSLLSFPLVAAGGIRNEGVLTYPNSIWYEVHFLHKTSMSASYNLYSEARVFIMQSKQLILLLQPLPLLPAPDPKDLSALGHILPWTPGVSWHPAEPPVISLQTLPPPKGASRAFSCYFRLIFQILTQTEPGTSYNLVCFELNFFYYIIILSQNSFHSKKKTKLLSKVDKTTII